jgi:hypothetical protein
MQYTVLLGDPLSLVCGTDLDSNPQATITWTAPDRAMITGTSRYSLENGPEIVRLNFTRTNVSDAGMWRCEIRTESDQYVVSNGSLIRMDPKTIGIPIQRDIELMIIGEYGIIIRVSSYTYRVVHNNNIMTIIQPLLVSHIHSPSKRGRLHCFRSAGKLQSSLIPISHTT